MGITLAAAVMFGAPPSYARGITHDRKAEAALTARLTHAGLSFQWVVCVDMNRFYGVHRLIRCNVDFGDPHIVQYCGIFVGSHLITDRENAALNCDRRL